MLCFTQTEFEFFGGIPINWENGNILGYEASTQITSISLGFGLTTNNNEKSSFFVFYEVIFPQVISFTAAGVSASADRSDYTTLLGMQAFVGTVFNLFSDTNGKLKVPLSLGIRLMLLAAFTDYVHIFGGNIGFGTGAGLEYQINNRICLFGRVMLYYDFLSYSQITIGSSKESTSGLISAFGITPNIGIKFNIQNPQKSP